MNSKWRTDRPIEGIPLIIRGQEEVLTPDYRRVEPIAEVRGQYLYSDFTSEQGYFILNVSGWMYASEEKEAA